MAIFQCGKSSESIVLHVFTQFVLEICITILIAQTQGFFDIIIVEKSKIQKEHHR